jgi:hypothetical protein
VRSTGWCSKWSQRRLSTSTEPRPFWEHYPEWMPYIERSDLRIGADEA